MITRLLTVPVVIDTACLARHLTESVSLEIYLLVEHMQSDVASMEFWLAEHTDRSSPNDSASMVKHIRLPAASLRNLRRLIRLCKARAKKAVTITAPSNRDTRGHSCECRCVHCERNGTGYFAQRAVLDGDESAAEHLSPEIYATLAAERSSRLAGMRKGVSA